MIFNKQRYNGIYWFFILLMTFSIMLVAIKCHAWVVKGPINDLKEIEKFNKSLPPCIIATISKQLRTVYIKDENNVLTPFPVCAISFHIGFTVIALHHTKYPNMCPLLETYAHELGHQFDWELGISTDPMFIAAVKKDFINLKDKDIDSKLHFNSYMREPKEMAAELFALEFLGPDYYKVRNRDMFMFLNAQAVYETHLCQKGKW